uniref:BPH6 n=1 Tax=Oryza sativa TaxID=4530 RepID=A0A286R6G2_ORYSA|nr:BPH6 [Oryza sativa]ASV63918.1 BPH6 [Oryza sativa]
MQRKIAEELKLDSETMALFDKKDEDDDFRGPDQGSRDVITSVSATIYKTLMGSRFIIIFLNGSDDEMDMPRFGIPTFQEYDNNKMIWTFSRRFPTVNREYSDIKDKLRHTHLSSIFNNGGNELSSSEFCALLREEADTIISRHPSMTGFDTAMAMNCCLYELFLRYNFHTATKFGWVSHASNYWLCDGIIQENIAKSISSALQQEIRWDCDDSSLDTALEEFMKEPPFMVVKDDNVYGAGQYHWISITSKDTEVSSMQSIPAVTSSFFLTFETADDSKPKALPASIFRHSSNLRVLVLCYCGFDFASPPFLICHGLKFLGLDHCTNDSTCERDQHVDWTALSSLYVLDLRYTEWDEITSQEKIALMYNLQELNIVGFRCWQHYARRLQGQLPCLRRLRVVKPTDQADISTDIANSFVEKTQLEILDLSGDTSMETIPNSMSNVDSLLVLIVDGCDRLKNVIVSDGVFPSLTSFSFDGYGPTYHWASTVELPPKEMRPFVDNKRDIKTCKISLKGCARLENLFLRQLPNLVELDLSGTAIKILDFTSMVVEVSCLKRLFLLGCKQLHAIKWDNSGSTIKPDLELLCVDTRSRSKYPQLFVDKNKSPGFLSVHAVIVDARIARSLYALIEKTSYHVDMNIHVTSSTVYSEVESEGTYRDSISQLRDHVNMQQQDLRSAGQYHDVQLSMVGDVPMQSFPLPPTTMLSRHIEIAQGSHNLESELDDDSPIPTLAHLAKHKAESLHVHDLSTITPLPGEQWRCLKWCRIERCPKIEIVFPRYAWNFDRLETAWVSDLLMARCIWSKGPSQYRGSFQNLQHLHLRSCPRLQFVLPVWVSSFPDLKTLHVIHCSNLHNIFVLEDGDYPEQITVKGVAFPKLTTIHLHDLPMLRQICDVEFKMVAPALETIKIRGCWGLRRLPAVAADGPKPAVEIEKDVWDALEWDGVEADHHPSLFQAPVHSRYYRKKLPRGSVLRYMYGACIGPCT